MISCKLHNIFLEKSDPHDQRNVLSLLKYNVGIKNSFEQGGIVPLTAGAIAPAVEQIAFPVTGICPAVKPLKLYANYVPYNLSAWIKLLPWKMG